jgi:hypothetical protein
VTKTTKELADRNVAMLADPEACPSDQLYDNTVLIQERFDAALAALVARIQAEVRSRHDEWILNGFPRQDPPLIRAMPAHNGFIRITSTYLTHDAVAAAMVADDARQEGRSRSVIDGLTRDGHTVGFVEVGTGLLWKAATRTAPALNYPRGCLFDLEAIPAGEFEMGTFDMITTKIDLG